MLRKAKKKPSRDSFAKKEIVGAPLTFNRIETSVTWVSLDGKKLRVCEKKLLAILSRNSRYLKSVKGHIKNVAKNKIKPKGNF